MKPIARTPSQPRSTIESSINTPAYKAGWLYKRGMFYDYFIIETYPEELIQYEQFFVNLNIVISLDFNPIIESLFSLVKKK